jgi:hypothetical protein
MAWEDCSQSGLVRSVGDTLSEVEESAPSFLIRFVHGRSTSVIDILGVLRTCNLPHPEWANRITSIMGVRRPCTDDSSSTANLAVLDTLGGPSGNTVADSGESPPGNSIRTHGYYTLNRRCNTTGTARRSSKVHRRIALEVLDDGRSGLLRGMGGRGSSVSTGDSRTARPAL